jgi:hypothetical protein
MSEKEFTPDAMVVKALENVMFWQEHQTAVRAAMQAVNETWYNRDSVDCGKLLNSLYDCELREWHNLMLFGLAVSDDTRQRVKAAAYQRFLAGNVAVNKWLSDSPTVPCCHWLSADDTAFREMCRRTFAPSDRTGVDNASST